jgi:hypothetical protein
MARHLFGSLFGGLVGGFAMYMVGFIFWGTPLSAIALAKADPQASAAVQTVLAQSFTTTGSGTYVVPDASTPEGTTLYGRGPIAMVHFNTAGYPVMDSKALIGGLVLALIAGIIVAAALRIAALGLTTFADRARVALLFAFAIPLYIDIGQPVFNHADWAFYIYSFICDFLGFAVAGLVIARWFLPKTAAVSPTL